MATALLARFALEGSLDTDSFFLFVGDLCIRDFWNESFLFTTGIFFFETFLLRAVFF
jgi:hypothetical protein